MTVIELARLVKEMRDAQREYFRYRGSDTLDRSKRLERELDKTVKTILEDHPALLPGFGERPA